MVFRRKKKKHVVDDNQLLLFTMEEMKGGEALTSHSETVPPTVGGDEGLQKEQAPIAEAEQNPEWSSLSSDTSTTEDAVSATEYGSASAMPKEACENHQEDSQESSFHLTDNRYTADHQLLLESMRKAILRLSIMSNHDIRLVAIESATHAQEGINTEHIYCLQALNGQELSGYDFIAYYYVSFARSFPTMLDKIDLPFSDIYEEALSLGR